PPLVLPPLLFFFFFNDTPPTAIYTLSLHDALPIWSASAFSTCRAPPGPTTTRSSSPRAVVFSRAAPSRFHFLPKYKKPSASTPEDRKSTRLNSSHVAISYAVFCLKKKKKKNNKQNL